MKDDPAFPANSDELPNHTGLTKLEYASIEAMKGYLSSKNIIATLHAQAEKADNCSAEKLIAYAAVRQAEALLKELKND